MNKNQLNSSASWSTDLDPMTCLIARTNFKDADRYIVNLNPCLHSLEEFIQVVKFLRDERHLTLTDQALECIFEDGQAYAVMENPEDMSTIEMIGLYAKVPLVGTDSVVSRQLKPGTSYIQLANIISEKNVPYEIQEIFQNFLTIDAQPQSLCNDTPTIYATYENDFFTKMQAKKNGDFVGSSNSEAFWQTPCLSAIHDTVCRQIETYGSKELSWYGVVFNPESFPKIAASLQPLKNGVIKLNCGLSITLFDPSLNGHPRDGMYKRLINRDVETMKRYGNIAEFKSA